MMNDQVGVTEELANDNVEATIDNTKATDANTMATVQSGSLSSRVEGYRMMVCSVVVAATLTISWFNPKFAENQAGLILSGVVGGIFGAATTQTRR